MPRIWICEECGKEQKNQELQCDCGNILPTAFREKDNIDKANETEGISKITQPPKEEIKTMVDETPHVEEKEEIIEKPKKKKRKKKKG